MSMGGEAAGSMVREQILAGIHPGEELACRGAEELAAGRKENAGTDELQREGRGNEGV